VVVEATGARTPGPTAAPSRFSGVLRYLTAGESHGRALVVILEGVPAGLLVTAEDVQRGLSRRRLGFGRGPRMRFEVDEVSLVGVPGWRQAPWPNSCWPRSASTS
jgi:hypothetical protein